MLTMKLAYEYGTRKLKEVGIEEAKLDAWYLLEFVTGISRAAYLADLHKELSKEQELKYFLYIEKRAQRIPLQHLTGEQEFMGLTFSVNEQVLIPRQDTETVVETALDALRAYVENVWEKRENPLRILDMCTGSGCILLSILYYMKKDFPSLALEGTGIDISFEALETAKINAEKFEIAADWQHSDLFSGKEGSFRMIVSNPPYIRTADLEELQEEVRYYDPRIALDGKEDGLFFYRKLIDESREHLDTGGYLVFEIGHDQAQEVTVLMENSGFSDICVKKDLSGLDRVVMGVYDK